MLISKRLATILAFVALATLSAGTLEARTRKGDRLLSQGKKAEQLKDWETALDLYREALVEDPAEVTYRLAVKRVRFQAGQAYILRGQKLREEGNLAEALAAFARAREIDPSSLMADEELRRTQDMLEAARKREEERKAAPPGEEAALAEPERVLTPAEAARHDVEQRLTNVQNVPVLVPLSTKPITLKMTNQPPRVLFETIGKLAGINVLFDPDYQQQATARPPGVELTNATLEQALDYVAMITRSYWKPISSNAIFVTLDNPAKRRDYEDHVAKVFFVKNATSTQELTEITGMIRGVANIQRVFNYNAQNAIIVRGTPDQVALAEMLLHNLDRPRSEVVVDVIVMEVNRGRARDLAATIASGGATGISIPILFTPRNPVLTGQTDDDNGGSAPTSNLISLARLGRVSTNDYSVTLPGAFLTAVMSDRGTKVHQAPQVRAVDGQKASLRIGDRVPYSTGGFQPVFGQVGTGANSLYSTFQFLDVGVNVDITPKVHGPEDVSLHIELDISNVRDRVDIGGISQPLVGQRKVVHDIRLRQGEVSLLGGLVQDQETKAVSGVPGLGNVPILRRLFTSETIERSESELLIAIVPHVVRTQGLDDLSFRGIATGTEQVIRLSYTPRPHEPAVPVEAPAPPVTPPIPPEPKPAPPAPPVGEPRLLFRQAVVGVEPGATFNVQLQVENVRDLFSATPLRIKFDPNFLRMSEATRGGLLAGDGREVLFTRNILNDIGEAVVNLSRMPDAGGISGSGTLVTFTFQAVARGSTVVAAPDLTLRDSQGQPVLTAAPQVTVNIE